MKKLRVAFLLDDLSVNQYAYDLVQHVAENELFDQPIAIHGYKSEGDRLSIAGKLLSKLKQKGFIGLSRAVVFSLLVKLIRKVELKPLSKQHPEYGKSFSLNTIAGLRDITISGEWSASKLFLLFTPDDIEKIRSEQIDVIIRCGSGILKGDILSASRFGVLSFHHGDNRTYRGGPSGFWEVLNDESSSGFIIQRLNDELDGGDVLLRGNIMTSNTWHSNNANLLAKSNVFFKKLLDQIAINDHLPKPEGPILHDRTLYKIDKITILLKYIWRILAPVVTRKVSSKIFGLHVGRWSIAYAKHDNFKKSLWRYKELANPKGRFFADPFIYKSNDRTVIFVEDLFYSDNKGRISAIDITEGKEDFLGVVLEEEFHLSFPFIIENEGSIYMIPETGELQEIRLYECVDFPMQWKLKAVLMTGVSAVDTMMFRKADKWFMFTNICSAGLGDHQSELHIYWSDSLEGSNWQPIASGNPVIFDSESARNGGFFMSDGDMYRINQIHDKGHYGKGFGINIINALGVDSYHETRVKNVNPCFKKDIDCTHHFNAHDEIAVVDYCRFVPSRKALND